MECVYNDGGRSKYFTANKVGDCVTRAISIATGIDYKVVYDRLKQLAQLESERQIRHHRGGRRSSVRDGVFKETWKKYLNELGWVHHSVCGIGKGITMHLTEEEIPEGTLIVQISKHLTCVKDKVIHDTYNCSVQTYYDEFGDLIINNKRAVYGYWTAPEKMYT